MPSRGVAWFLPERHSSSAGLRPWRTPGAAFRIAITENFLVEIVSETSESVSTALLCQALPLGGGQHAQRHPEVLLQPDQHTIDILH
jgi:hypothetical protein